MSQLPFMVQASPIVKVAIEPVRPTEMSQLEEGLKLLNRADPFVEVSTLESGEHVIGAAGACSGTAIFKAGSGLETGVDDLAGHMTCIGTSISAPAGMCGKQL
jgi:hypothetical protein